MTAPELTSRILATLLRRQAADTDQLLALLCEEHPTSRGLLDIRLQALHDQQLVTRLDGAWLLTDDGLTVARSSPAAFGLSTETPLTASATSDGRTDAVTSLALSFLRAHHAAFGNAPFEWEPQPRLRSRDRLGRCYEVRPTAAMKTFHYGRRGLEPVNALVDLWTGQREADAAAERLRAYAELAAAGGDNPAKGPWRRWLGIAPFLLIAVPSDSVISVVGRTFREAVEADSNLQDLFDSVPIGVASVDAVAEAGVDAAIWWSPIGRRNQVWPALRCRVESRQGTGMLPAPTSCNESRALASCDSPDQP